jgi:hypothetical protein
VEGLSVEALSIVTTTSAPATTRSTGWASGTS